VAEASFSGLNHLPETRERISQSLKGRFSGVNNPIFGRTGENHPMFGKTGPNLGKVLHLLMQQKFMFI